MLKVKRVLALFVALVLTASFVACSTAAEQAQVSTASSSAAAGSAAGDASADAAGGDEQVKAAVIFGVPDPANGGGFERMMLTGVDALREKYGWQVDIAENVAYAKVSEVAASYCDKGYNVVFFPDNGMKESWKELPPQYPDTYFAMMTYVEEQPSAPNALAIVPPKYGYGVIVGETMAKMSKSGKIGLVGGLPVGSIMLEFSGIIEGCKTISPETEVLVGWTGDYVDIPKHSEVTNQLIQQGADVIFTVTGPGYKGVWEAAETAGAGVVGYSYDSYDIAPNVVVGSVCYDGPLQYEMVAQMYEDGTLEGKLYQLGYECVTIADFRGSVDEATEKDIRDTAEKIANGEIVVPEVVWSDTEMASGVKE